MTTGGAEAVVLNVARALGPKGYDFHLLTTRSESNSWQDKFLSAFRTVILLNPDAVNVGGTSTSPP